MSAKKSKSKQNTPALIATIVVAMLAIIAVVVLTVMLNAKGGSDNPASSVEEPFRPTAEFEQECQYAAHDLVSAGYEVIKLFKTEGLPRLSEPYGNAPEDGIYTVDTVKSGKYSSYEDVENLVKSIYSEAAAEKILHDIDGKGFEVYKKRRILTDADNSADGSPQYKETTVLGINAEFKPDTSRESLWASCSLAVLPTSETSCDITVYLGGVDENTGLSTVDEKNILRTKMTKSGDKWLLEDFLY